MIGARGVSLVRGDRRPLTDVSLTLGAGELVVVIGANGAGKSTLLRALAGAEPLTAGEVRVDGRLLGSWRPTDLARRRAVVSQGDEARPELLAADVVALGRLPWGGADPSDPLVLGALAEAGARTFGPRPVGTLSGGERQRVHLARALAQVAGTQGPILLLDEPTSAQDPAAQEFTLAVLRQRARAGAAVLVTLHDVNLAATWADRIVAVSGGRIVADGPPSAVLTRERMRQIFGVDFHVFPHPDHGRPQAVTARTGAHS